MTKENASFDESTARQMAERVSNFRDALHDPDKKIGEKRAQRKADPNFEAPEPVEVTRFDQLDKQDRWSRTEYREADGGSGRAAVTVQDPKDPDDLHCTHITADNFDAKRKVTGEEDREFHEEKLAQLNLPDVEDDEVQV